MKKFTAAIIAAVLCLVLAGCGSVSLLKPEETTTKKAFDENAFDEEFRRTSVYEEPSVTEETTGESETQSEPSTVKTPETTTKAETVPSSAAASETVTAAPETTSAAPETKNPFTRPATTAKTVVDTKIETKETKSDLKYGVKKIQVVSTYYDIYSDGSKVETDKKTYYRYDTSGYKASTSDLMSEAKSNKSAHSGDIRSAANTVNSYRDGSSLTLDDDLCVAASVRATEMAYSGKLSSTRPGGSNYSSVLKDMGIEYKNCIELTCKGYSDGASAMEALKSKAQNLNIMKSQDYKKIGVGVAQAPDGSIYWSLILTD